VHLKKMNNGIVITTSENISKDSIKELWKMVFGDTEQYISIFFEKRFDPSQCVVAVKDNDLVGMLFLLPFVRKQKDADYSGRYIYAVATHPDHRRSGISTAMLEFAHQKAKNEGAALSALVPASDDLFVYYAKRGFKTEFFKREEEISVVPKSDCMVTPVLLQDMIALRREVFKDSRAFVDWDEKALSHQQSENDFLGGETLYFSEPGSGYALCVTNEESVFIREWAAEKIYPEVLAAIAERYGKEKIFIRLTACENEMGALPFAMTRWYISERKAQRGGPAMISLVLD